MRIGMGEGVGGRIGVDSIIGVEAKEAPKPKENENPYADSEFVAPTPVVENGDAQKKVEATLELKKVLHKMNVDMIMADPGRGIDSAQLANVLGQAKEVLSFPESDSESAALKEYIRDIGNKLASDIRQLETSNVRGITPEQNRAMANKLTELENMRTSVDEFLSGTETGEQKIAA